MRGRDVNFREDKKKRLDSVAGKRGEGEYHPKQATMDCGSESKASYVSEFQAQEWAAIRPRRISLKL